MNLYTQIFLSIFIIFPYSIITNDFFSESNTLLNSIFNKELKRYAFNILFSLYFIIYFICLILGFCEFIIVDIVSGFITLCNSVIFYKPSTIKNKNKSIDYFPHLEVIYSGFIGIYFIIHGILLLIKKTKDKKYFAHFNEDVINILDNNSFLLNKEDMQKHPIECNNISFELSKTNLSDIFFFVLTHKLKKLIKKKKCYVTNFTKNDLNFEFVNNALIVSITDMTIKIDNESISIKKFKGKVLFAKNKIKINVLEKGVIKNENSFFKNIFLKGLYNLFSGIAVDKVESKINKKLEKINIKKDIFNINIFIQEINVSNESLKINFNSLIDIKN